MCEHHFLRFVTSAEAEVEVLPWGPHEWLARAGLTDSKLLQLVRVKMPPGKAHAFHRHPCMEELLYYVEGRAEQWVGTEKRILKAGDVAHVPMNEVHGTYNVFDEPVTFLAVLSPAVIDGPALIDVSQDEPWRSIRALRAGG
ncbi:MAG: cupin domain-containing protein [Planctomycetes bacterium]|nr:cupin domain-containing protein [Planctomycetota bacterium]